MKHGGSTLQHLRSEDGERRVGQRQGLGRGNQVLGKEGPRVCHIVWTLSLW